MKQNHEEENSTLSANEKYNFWAYAVVYGIPSLVVLVFFVVFAIGLSSGLGAMRSFSFSLSSIVMITVGAMILLALLGVLLAIARALKKTTTKTNSRH